MDYSMMVKKLDECTSQELNDRDCINLLLVVLTNLIIRVENLENRIK